MPRAPLVAALLLVGCATPTVALERAQADAAAGRFAEALRRFDSVAGRRDVTDSLRVDALIGAARACDAVGDPDGARARLERAVARDVPGVVEVAEFELAERVRDKDHARALSLYYRAAGGAEKYRNGGFPYRAAMDRSVARSMSR